MQREHDLQKITGNDGLVDEGLPAHHLSRVILEVARKVA